MAFQVDGIIALLTSVTMSILESGVENPKNLVGDSSALYGESKGGMSFLLSLGGGKTPGMKVLPRGSGGKTSLKKGPLPQGSQALERPQNSQVLISSHAVQRFSSMAPSQEREESGEKALPGRGFNKKSQGLALSPVALAKPSRASVQGGGGSVMDSMPDPVCVIPTSEIRIGLIKTHEDEPREKSGPSTNVVSHTLPALLEEEVIHSVPVLTSVLSKEEFPKVLSIPSVEEVSVQKGRLQFVEVEPVIDSLVPVEDARENVSPPVKSNEVIPFFFLSTQALFAANEDPQSFVSSDESDIDEELEHILFTPIPPFESSQDEERIFLRDDNLVDEQRTPSVLQFKDVRLEEEEPEDLPIASPSRNESRSFIEGGDDAIPSPPPPPPPPALKIPIFSTVASGDLASLIRTGVTLQETSQNEKRELFTDQLKLRVSKPNLRKVSPKKLVRSPGKFSGEMAGMEGLTSKERLERLKQQRALKVGSAEKNGGSQSPKKKPTLGSKVIPLEEKLKVVQKSLMELRVELEELLLKEKEAPNDKKLGGRKAAKLRDIREKEGREGELLRSIVERDNWKKQKQGGTKTNSPAKKILSVRQEQGSPSKKMSPLRKINAFPSKKTRSVPQTSPQDRNVVEESLTDKKGFSAKLDKLFGRKSGQKSGNLKSTPPREIDQDNQDSQVSPSKKSIKESTSQAKPKKLDLSGFGLLSALFGGRGQGDVSAQKEEELKPATPLRRPVMASRDIENE